MSQRCFLLVLCAVLSENVGIKAAQQTTAEHPVTNMGWIPIAVSLATLIVGTIVPLTIAALHRKQMRQIELHRADPSVPIIPPPHPVTQFFKRNWVVILVITGISGNLFALILELRETGPITRGQVFRIALSTVSVAYILVAQGMMKSSAQIYGTIDRLIDLLEMLKKITDSTKH